MGPAEGFSLIAQVKHRLNRGNVRTVKAVRNIVLSFLYKGVNIAAGLLLVRYALAYLDPARYGIWLTLSSIILWFNFFDVGLGHGMRNKLAASVAMDQKEIGTRYVSTAYGVLAMIATIFFCVFLLVNHFLNWNFLLNTSDVPGPELSALALLVFGSFSFRLVFRLITSVALALQSPSVRDGIESVSRVMNLGLLILLYHTTKGSLLYLGVVYSITPLIVMVAFSVYLYGGPYRQVAPRIKYFDWSLAGSIMGLGSRFFVLQISAVILFTTDNFIIAHLFSPTEVTPYHIAHRYFGVAAMGFSIIVAPFWSATTDAYVKNEYGWLRQAVKRLLFLWGAFIVLILTMLFLSERMYSVWIGNMVTIPFALSIVWAVYTAQQTVHAIFVRFINGVGKIRVQMIHAVASALVNIPLSIYLAKNLGFGVVGVIAATTITQLSGLCLMIIQYNKVINRKAYGIWNR